MSLKKFLVSMIALFVIIGSVESLKADPLLTKVINESNGSYVPISGTVLGSGDDNEYNFNSPFTFLFDDVAVTTLRASDNGWLAFNNTTLGSLSMTPTSSAMVVTACNEDLMSNNATNAGNVSWTVEGTAPNRIITVQWKGMVYFGNATPNMNFQVKINEDGEVSFVYGSGMNNVAVGSNNSIAFMTGATTANYINIEPGSPSTFYYSNVTPNTGRLLTTTVAPFLPSGKTYSMKKPLPSLTSITPLAGHIFARGSVFPAPSVTLSREATQPSIRLEYQIIDLKTQVPIYIASKEGDINTTTINPNPQPEGEDVVYTFTHASGVAAKMNPASPDDADNTGEFDLLTNAANIPGGEYIAIAKLIVPDEDNYEETIQQKFIIALENDLSITTVGNPKPKTRIKYLIDNVVPLDIRVTNIGLNDVSSFDATVKVYRNDTGTLVYEDQFSWSNPNNPMSTGDYYSVDFSPFRTQRPLVQVGDYRVEYSVVQKNIIDDEPSNNIVPNTSQSDLVFEVAYNNEPAVYSINAPVGSIYVDRPVKTRATFINNGVLDLTNVNASMTITGPMPSTNIVYQSSTLVPELQFGKYNTNSFPFPESLTITEPGQYKITVLCTHTGDKDLSNNSMVSYFTAIDAMSGTYTIGNTVSGTRNYSTFEDAVNDLYTKGVSGPVEFELTDQVYNIGSKSNSDLPSLDLSSTIIGASAENTITFKPSQSKAVTKGSVNINLRSGNGIGIYIAQNVEPSQPNAVVHLMSNDPNRDDAKRFYSNSRGYLIFDGGSQKSFKFNLDTDEPFKSVFYLGNGASNNTIKNCIIEGTDAGSYKCSLPLTVYSSAQGGFKYEANKRSNTLTYTAGVVMRSTVPINAKFQANTDQLDTLVNANNVIMNNEISGFAYGVASMGIGQLLVQGTGHNEEFYNTDNEIKNNVIHNVGRAGVFVGHEANSNIAGNRIYDIEGGCLGLDAAGIMAGGQSARGYFGYNNRMVNIMNNEISSISGSGMVSGIRVEQSPQQLVEGSILTTFPINPESMVIAGNIVWELLPNDANTARAGIYVFTQRSSFDVPFISEYSSRNDVIANNTIIVNGDDGVMNTRAVMGVGLQNVTGTILKNNAIATMDNEYAETCPVSACVFYEGPSMMEAGITSDRNVYWTENSESSVYRWIETDANGNKLSEAAINEYKTLPQWQVWSKTDKYSVYSKFMSDYEFVGTNPQNLRVKSNPMPLNSVLNNRGDIMDETTSDITGKVRGSAGQRYDIGALEFGGRVYVSDMESTTITAPASYRSTEGTFADAEHIMTEAPVEVKARLRNNGSLFQTGTEVRVEIYRELPTGTFGAAPDYEQMVKVDATSDEYVDVNFMLADGKGLEFEPETYADLRLNPMYAMSVPEVYSEMTANVTPRYKIVVITENDEDNTNNETSKIVRFFVRRSWMDMLISSEYVNADLSNNPTETEIAGKLNHDRVVEGLGFVGWHVAINPNATTIVNDTIDYDVFDRNNWEARAVDYGHYRTVVWSDAHDQMDDADVKLSRYEELDIENYFANGMSTDKKNMILASQEMIRNNGMIARDLFRATDHIKADPEVIDYTKVTGSAVGRNLTNTIAPTGFMGDAAPNPALVDIWDGGEGNAKLAYYYTNELSGTGTLLPEDKVMGVATSTIGTNVCYLGADWRHIADIETMLRSVFDFAEANGGIIIPIELATFDASAVGNRVDLNWSTLSEISSDRFDVERTEVTDGYADLFSKISEVAASGTSHSTRNYNTADYGVEFGKKYAYRLKMIDRDGKFEYSQIEEVEIDSPNGLTVSEVLPNPVSSTSKVKVNGAVTANIYLSDMSGRKVVEYANGSFEGNEIVIDASNLTSGSYTLVIEQDGVVITRNVRVVK